MQETTYDWSKWNKIIHWLITKIYIELKHVKTEVKWWTNFKVRWNTNKEYKVESTNSVNNKSVAYFIIFIGK